MKPPKKAPTMPPRNHLVEEAISAAVGAVRQQRGERTSAERRRRRSGRKSDMLAYRIGLPPVTAMVAPDT